MFIYQKNKINDVTGQVEQSLNVTFEGNKPVETPDVVITKDGVTGIKSDSKAYTFSAWGDLNISTYSVDGEIVPFNNYSGYTALPFAKSVGFNVTSIEGQSVYFNIAGVDNGDSFTLMALEGPSTTFYFTSTGEYVIDMVNKIFYLPNGSTISLENSLRNFKTVYGFVMSDTFYGG